MVHLLARLGTARLQFDDATNHRRALKMIRRLSPLFMLVAVLAGCSSGSSKVANSTQSTSTTPSSSTSATASPTSSPTASTVTGGGASDFCGAFKELDSLSGATNPAAAGAAFQAAAADMRRYAPAAIKDAAGTYANLVDTIGKAAQSGNLGMQGLQKALADGMAGKSADITAVAVWVGQNCH